MALVLADTADEPNEIQGQHRLWWATLHCVQLIVLGTVLVSDQKLSKLTLTHSMKCMNLHFNLVQQQKCFTCGQ
jgi:hypothetical protein